MHKMLAAALISIAVAACGGKSKPVESTPESSVGSPVGGATYGGATYGGATYGGANPCAELPANPCSGI
ncbi:MAG: hypothetical protein R3B48_00215 [Kofleriaceae bacterium]